MRSTVKRSADGDTFQLVLEAQNDEEDEDLRDLYLQGSIQALGETSQGRAQLVLATQVEPRRR